MGIQGLLPLLKSIQKPCNLKKFAGQTVGVDAYGWLHRGARACAIELALGKSNRKFVDFAMHRVRMLQHFGVTPFLVFDGDYLPSKANTEEERSRRRKEGRKFGLELLNAGKTSQANIELQKAIEITPEMARQLIEELKKTGVKYIVAPYEADAQMAYLERKGVISAILSEDSDLLVFGAKCLLTKLDQYGNCIEINRADFRACREINLAGWSDKEFRRMAILSGCDYLTSINNMGLKTAHRMVRKYKTIEKILQMLQFEGKYHIPEGYLEAFYQAEFAFLHQRVYCPLSETIVYYTQPDVSINDTEMPFIGKYIEPAVARRVATGELNPMTKEPITLKSPRTVSKTQQLRHPLPPDDPKKGVSIEKYFKPNRIPLGEMDPNCFTPTSNQHRRLPRNSSRWPDDMPRPYIFPSTAEQGPQQPGPIHKKIQVFTSRSAGVTPISESRPSKRSRLCADNESNEVSNSETGVLPEQSHFFSVSVTKQSSSISKLTKVKRSKKEDCFTVFSDDSLDQALLSLPDCDNWNSQDRDFDKVTEAQSSLSNSHPSSEAESKLLNDDQPPSSQSSICDSTQSTTVVKSIDAPLTPADSSPQSIFSCLKEKYAFIPRTQKLSALQTPSSTKLSRLPRAINSLPTPSSISHARVLTPLQRIGIKALGMSQPPTPPHTPTARNSTLRCPVKPKLGDANFVPFPEVTVHTKTEYIDVPLPRPGSKEDTGDASVEADVGAINSSVTNIGEIKGKGSEDLIVRDSEDEYDQLSSPTESYGPGVLMPEGIRA